MVKSNPPFTIYHSPFTNSSPSEDAEYVGEVVAPDFEPVDGRLELGPVGVGGERAEVGVVARDGDPGRGVDAELLALPSVVEDARGQARVARDAARDAFE